MGTRLETLVGQDVAISFRHFVNGVLTDIDTVEGIQIYDQLGSPVHFIAANAIFRVDLGCYTATVPGSVLSSAQIYRDEWRYVSIPAGPTNKTTFTINVVTSSLAIDPEVLSGQSCTLEDLTSCKLKKFYLWPVWGVLADGYYLPDSLLYHFIDSAIGWAERVINMPMRSKRVLTRPYSEGYNNPVLGVDYDEDGMLHQWSIVNSYSWSAFKLPHTNINRILGIRGIYGGRAVYRIPIEWVDRNELRMGWVRVRPTTTGSINTLIDNSGQFLDVTLLEAVGNNTVPGFWAVDYEYGMKNNQIPVEICNLIMKKAAIVLLDQIGMQITQGLTSRSASVDGLSSSIGFTANAERTLFGALARRYEEEVEAVNLDDFKRKYKGPNIVIL